jgi:hypothetical protein
MINMATQTPTEFAATVDSTGREVRKFLRSITPKDEQPGKGSRWELPTGKREVTKLEKQFSNWKAEQAEKAAAKAAEAEVDEDEVLED